MKRILIIGGTVLGLVLAAALIVPFLIPASVYKAQIEKAATEALSREVTLSGNPKVSVIPRISARIGGVTVANAEGFEGSHLIKAGELSASVKWLPLLARKVEIERFSFIDADVNLQKKADGTVNWDLEAFKPKKDKDGNEIVDTTVGRAELKNARLVFADAGAGTRYEVSELDLFASMKALNKPLKAKGRGLFQGERFDVNLTLDHPQQLSDKAPAALKASLESALGNAAFDGTLTSAEKISLDGAFTAGSENLKGLAAFSGTKLDFDLAQLGKVSATGKVSGALDALKISIDEASQTSGLLKTGFTGELALGTALVVNGDLTVSAPSVAALAKFAKAELPVKADVLGSVNAKAKINGKLPEPSIAFDSLALKGPLLTANYSGMIVPGKVPQLDGSFTASAVKAGELATALGIKLEAPQLFEKADVTGRIKGPADALTLTGLKASHAGTQLTAAYSGNVTLAKVISLDGTLNATLPQASDFARQMKIEIPAANAIEKVEFSAAVKGPFESLQLSNLSLNHSGALINAAFNGGMQLGGDGALNGNFSASSQALRGLLKATGIEMAPGTTLQSFSAKGAVKGSFKTLGFQGLDLTLDAIRAKGSAGLDFRGAKPRMTGDLDMGTLDLTPFLGADPNKPKTPFGGWSKDPLDLAGLSAANADLKLRTSTLRIGKVELTNSGVVTTLQNGRLVADLPAFKAFAGDWSGRVTLDASGGTPVLTIAAEGKSVAMASLLGTLANFNRLDGSGKFKLNASASGTSIDAIMRDLDGEISTNLAEGTLKGFNVAQAVRSASSLKEAIATGNLRNLDFGGVLSASAETDFTKFDSVLKIQNGVATVDLMKMLNPVLGIDGTGKIDIGAQGMDLRLATAIDKKAQGTGSVVQLNGIPVPVRLSGNWMKLKVTPDFSGVEKELKASVGGQIRDGIIARTGETGQVIGDVIGLPKKPAPVPVPAPPADGSAPVAPAAPAKAPSLGDLKDKAVKDALGGLLGKKKPAPPPAPAPPPESAPAPEPVPEAPPAEGFGG